MQFRFTGGGRGSRHGTPGKMATQSKRALKDLCQQLEFSESDYLLLLSRKAWTMEAVAYGYQEKDDVDDLRVWQSYCEDPREDLVQRFDEVGQCGFSPSP